MNALVEISVDTVMNQTGDQTSDQIGQRRDVRRRLSDKILAAFNHAYSVGEYEIAKQLKAALVKNEKLAGPHKEMRKLYNPQGEAELWIGLINSRNYYRTACDQNKNDPNAVAEALDSMKETYRLWSQG